MREKGADSAESADCGLTAECGICRKSTTTTAVVTGLLTAGGLLTGVYGVVSWFRVYGMISAWTRAKLEPERTKTMF